MTGPTLTFEDEAACLLEASRVLTITDIETYRSDSREDSGVYNALERFQKTLGESLDSDMRTKACTGLAKLVSKLEDSDANESSVDAPWKVGFTALGHCMRPWFHDPERCVSSWKRALSAETGRKASEGNPEASRDWTSAEMQMDSAVMDPARNELDHSAYWKMWKTHYDSATRLQSASTAERQSVPADVILDPYMRLKTGSSTLSATLSTPDNHYEVDATDEMAQNWVSLLHELTLGESQND